MLTMVKLLTMLVKGVNGRNSYKGQNADYGQIADYTRERSKAFYKRQMLTMYKKGLAVLIC